MVLNFSNQELMGATGEHIIQDEFFVFQNRRITVCLRGYWVLHAANRSRPPGGGEQDGAGVGSVRRRAWRRDGRAAPGGVGRIGRSLHSA